MRPRGNAARLDQIAELTRGLQLPLPALETAHLDVIADRVHRAFNDVRTQSPATVSLGIEAEVTALLEARLNSLIEEDTLWGQLVLCVARGKETVSYDGSHLEKRPDLSIYLSNRARQFPLVAEAKILDSASGRTEALYCELGLRRFLNGEYAWSNREALMIAYVRDGSTINSTLIPFLSDAMDRAPSTYLVETLPTGTGNSSTDVAYSRHGRSFVYVQQGPTTDQPGPITIWHLWLP